MATRDFHRELWRLPPAIIGALAHPRLDRVLFVEEFIVVEIAISGVFVSLPFISSIRLRLRYSFCRLQQTSMMPVNKWAGIGRSDFMLWILLRREMRWTVLLIKTVVLRCVIVIFFKNELDFLLIPFVCFQILVQRHCFLYVFVFYPHVFFFVHLVNNIASIDRVTILQRQLRAQRQLLRPLLTLPHLPLGALCPLPGAVLDQDLFKQWFRFGYHVARLVIQDWLLWPGPSSLVGTEASEIVKVVDATCPVVIQLCDFVDLHWAQLV